MPAGRRPADRRSDSVEPEVRGGPQPHALRTATGSKREAASRPPLCVCEDRLVSEEDRTIRGERVVLRPYRPDEADELLAHWLASPWRVGGGADAATARRRLRRRIARSGAFADGRLELAVDLDGRVVGDIEARHPPGAMPPGVYEIGIELYAEETRGQGVGSEAVELFTSHLFDVHAAGRVQATTAVTNGPMRAVLERLGFAEEGVLRAYMPTDAGREDYVMYAVTAEAWSAR